MYGGLLDLRIVFSKDGGLVYPDEFEGPLGELVYSSTLGDCQVQFHKDGFIKIDSPTKEEVLERLNCLVLCFRLLRLATSHIPVFKSDELCTIEKNYLFDRRPKSEEDLRRILGTGEVVLEEAVPEFVIKSAPCTQSSRSVFTISGEPHTKGPTPLININANELEIIADLAERVFSSRMRSQLITFIEAWTLRGESDWNTGFILSWICIEAMVFNQIIAIYGPDAIYVKEKGMIVKYPSGKNKEISAYRAIEILREALSGKDLAFAPHDESAFDETYLNKIQLIREIRNEIVHGDRRATGQELEECFQASARALWRIMKLAGIENYSDYLARIGSGQP